MTRLRELARRNLLVVTVCVVLVVLPFVVRDSFSQQVLIRMFIYAAGAQAWNILGGYAGQTSFGHAIFFGAGAYAAAISAVDYSISPWIGLLLGSAVACLIGLALGAVCFGLSGRYFAIATMGIGEIVQLVALNWSVTRRAVGIYMPILPSSISSLQFHETKIPYYFLSLGILGLACATIALLRNTRVGYYWRAIKADQAVAESLGVGARRYKLMAVAVSSLLTGLLGAFYAFYVLVIDPFNVLRPDLSVMFVLLAAAGGVGELWGPILGAFAVVPLGELTRAKLGRTGGLDMVIFSSLIIVLTIVEPSGIQGLVRRCWRRLAQGRVNRASTALSS